MQFKRLGIPDVVLIEPKVIGDERGFFMETFRQNEFDAYCGHTSFVQENHSRSSKGVLRGLHYQLERAQGKLVRVIKGEVFDVAVDLRRNEPTFGQWVGVTLSAENKRQLWVPEGFAHGFYVVSDEAEFVYKCTNYYAPEYENILHWNDAELAIKWPIEKAGLPHVSEKDHAGLPLSTAKVFE